VSLVNREPLIAGTACKVLGRSGGLRPGIETPTGEVG